jgi:hypothetical protein
MPGLVFARACVRLLGHANPISRCARG